MAVLLSEAGLLERSCLLGSDCRGEAIEHAKLGLYDATMLKLVPSATRDKYFQPVGQQWRPVEALRQQIHWKVADLLAGVEAGPWDIILWRNGAIYLKSRPAELVWRRLVSVLAPQGVLIAGKADRPPADAGLRQVARCIYRRCSERGYRLRVAASVKGASPHMRNAIIMRNARGRRGRLGLGALPMTIGAKIGAGFAVGLAIIVAIGPRPT